MVTLRNFCKIFDESTGDLELQLVLFCLAQDRSFNTIYESYKQQTRVPYRAVNKPQHELVRVR